jgi:DNA (cytosine-5)-methyltransferase 1
VLSDLEALGYATWPLVVPACAVDARHRRDRVWIVAHANDMSCSRQRQHGRKVLSEKAAIRSGSGSYIKAVSNSHQTGWGEQCRPQSIPPELTALECGRRWLAEPELGRVAYGIPHRAHRLRGLGNAIVPQVAEVILREIARLTT